MSDKHLAPPKLPYSLKGMKQSLPSASEDKWRDLMKKMGNNDHTGPVQKLNKPSVMDQKGAKNG